jgi:hypothetical protein
MGLTVMRAGTHHLVTAIRVHHASVGDASMLWKRLKLITMVSAHLPVADCIVNRVTTPWLQSGYRNRDSLHCVWVPTGGRRPPCL